jgi:hypothetical protein
MALKVNPVLDGFILEILNVPASVIETVGVDANAFVNTTLCAVVAAYPALTTTDPVCCVGANFAVPVIF